VSAPPHDVLIVGGGPAGAALAARLARAGRRVVLCDAARFPRHKICGEFVPPAALAWLAGIGALPAVEALGPRRHAGMAVVSPGGIEVLGRYGGGARGLALRRYDLDLALLDHAARCGAEIRQECRVAALRRASGGAWEAVLAERRGRSGTARGRVLVGADGRNSLVARRLGLRRAPRHRRWAIMAHCRGVEDPGDHGTMIVTPYGYCGINPLPDGLANVCVVVDPRRPEGRLPPAPLLARRFLEILASHPETRRRTAGAVLEGEPRAIGPIAARAARAVGEAALLVGDAAGFYDPFTGEGIGAALQGAALAAPVIETALDAADLSERALSPYAWARRDALGPRRRFDAALQAVLARPWLADRIAVRLRDDPRLADLLARICGAGEDPRRALSPRFLAGLLRASRRGHRPGRSRGRPEGRAAGAGGRAAGTAAPGAAATAATGAAGTAATGAA
jgi:geranylgeranyl reductase family protein